MVKIIKDCRSKRIFFRWGPVFCLVLVCTFSVSLFGGCQGGSNGGNSAGKDAPSRGPNYQPGPPPGQNNAAPKKEK